MVDTELRNRTSDRFRVAEIAGFKPIDARLYRPAGSTVLQTPEPHDEIFGETNVKWLHGRHRYPRSRCINSANISSPSGHGPWPEAALIWPASPASLKALPQSAANP